MIGKGLDGLKILSFSDWRAHIIHFTSAQLGGYEHFRPTMSGWSGRVLVTNILGLWAGDFDTQELHLQECLLE